MPIKMVRIVVAPTAVRGSKNNDDSSKKKEAYKQQCHQHNCMSSEWQQEALKSVHGRIPEYTIKHILEKGSDLYNSLQLFPPELPRNEPLGLKGRSLGRGRGRGRGLQGSQRTIKRKGGGKGDARNHSNPRP